MNLSDNLVFPTALIVLLAFCLALVCGCTGNAPAAGDTEEEKAAEALQSLKSGVFASLSDTLALAESTSKELKSTEHDQTQVYSILDESQKTYTWIESVAFIRPDGTVAGIKPNTYGDLVGVDLSYQDIVAEALAARSPIMSDYTLLELDEKGTLIEYPVFLEDDEFAGIVSVVIDPAGLIEPYAKEIKSGYGYSVMAAQPDGLILYDDDPAEIGNETFGNPMYENYPDIIELAKAYSSQPEGTYSYTFRDTGFENEVMKEVVWDTAGLLGKEWRLFIIREILPEM